MEEGEMMIKKEKKFILVPSRARAMKIDKKRRKRHDTAEAATSNLK